MMKTTAVEDLVNRRLIEEWKANREEIGRLDRWYRGNHDRPHNPRQATSEYKELAKRSSTPWLGLVVTSVAQNLYVEGFRRKNDPDDATPWRMWQANGLDARQIAIHRAALAHGLSYATVLPGTLHGEPMPVIRGVSARRMVAWYADPAEDDYPLYALRGDPIHTRAGQKRYRFTLLDSEAVYMLDAGADGPAKLIDAKPHPINVCPVVRYSNSLDLDGRTTGEVEPFIPIAARIDQDTFDRLVVQRFGAWVVRYIAGMVQPETDEERRAEKIRLQIEDLLVSESTDTKFGTLPATPLEPYIKARDADIRDLAAVTQTPPHHLLGLSPNLSAEALAAAESALTRKVEERRHMFGEAHEQTLRLAAHVAGDTDAAADFESEVWWRDTESRSLSQAADALGKMAQQLKIPVEALWERVPGVTQTDVERWKQLASDDDLLGVLAAQMMADLEPGAGA